MSNKTCGKCKHFHASTCEQWCAVSIEDCPSCVKFEARPITNGDEVRMRTNEELVEIIECPYGGCIHPHEEVPCKECILDRLNAPAESEVADE